MEAGVNNSLRYSRQRNYGLQGFAVAMANPVDPSHGKI